MYQVLFSFPSQYGFPLPFQADEHVVNKGLEDHPKERNALRDKPGNVSDDICTELVKLSYYLSTRDYFIVKVMMMDEKILQ